MDEYISFLKFIDWFSSCGIESEKYLVLESLFDAYDNWNIKMLNIWDKQISGLENKAVEILGNAEIDRIFEQVSMSMSDMLYEDWSKVIDKHENEMGLEDEFIDMVKRDLCWAYIERKLNEEGFFNSLLEAYQKGYFPVSWDGEYPGGRLVVL